MLEKIAGQLNYTYDVPLPLCFNFFLIVIIFFLICRQCRQLHNIKNQQLPKAPNTVEETINAVRASKYAYLLKDVAKYNDHTALIWFPNELPQILEEWTIEEISADATFRVVPEVFGLNGQHFTLLGCFNDNWLPMVDVTMTCKAEGLYQSALDRIKTLLPAFDPKIAHCDFEAAIANCRTAVFGCEIKGCFFHHNSAVRKKVGKLGFIGEQNKNKTLDAWLRSFYPLALLPPHKIREGLAWVEEEMPKVIDSFDSEEKKQQFRPMCTRVVNYYGGFWIGKVGEEKVSVYKQRHRTNNGAENYHSRLNKGLPRRPKFWLYPPRIEKFCKVFVMDVERLKKGKILTRANKETLVQKRITQYTADFDRTQDIGKFIRRARWLACKKIRFQDSSESDSDSGSLPPSQPVPSQSSNSSLVVTPPPPPPRGPNTAGHPPPQPPQLPTPQVSPDMFASSPEERPPPQPVRRGRRGRGRGREAPYATQPALARASDISMSLFNFACFGLTFATREDMAGHTFACYILLI